jgi:hypothetical protein
LLSIAINASGPEISLPLLLPIPVALDVEDRAREGTDIVIHEGKCESDVIVSALEAYDMALVAVGRKELDVGSEKFEWGSDGG